LHTSDTDRSSRCPRVDSSQSTLVSCLSNATLSKTKMKFESASMLISLVIIIGECKIINFFGPNKFSKYRYFGCCNDFEYMFSKHMPWTFQQTYPNFQQHVCFAAVRWIADDSAYRNWQHISMLAYFFFNLYFIVDISFFEIGIYIENYFATKI